MADIITPDTIDPTLASPGATLDPADVGILLGTIGKALAPDNQVATSLGDLAVQSGQATKQADLVSTLSQGQQPINQEGIDTAVSSSISPTQALNPSDLFGLTREDVNTAFAFKQTQDELNAARAADIASSIQAQNELAFDIQEAAREATDAERQFILDVEKSKLTDDIKEFQFLNQSAGGTLDPATHFSKDHALTNLYENAVERGETRDFSTFLNDYWNATGGLSLAERKQLIQTTGAVQVQTDIAKEINEPEYRANKVEAAKGAFIDQLLSPKTEEQVITDAATSIAEDLSARQGAQVSFTAEGNVVTFTQPDAEGKPIVVETYTLTDTAPLFGGEDVEGIEINTLAENDPELSAAEAEELRNLPDGTTIQYPDGSGKFFTKQGTKIIAQ